MHQIRFRRGLCPRPRWGAYRVPPIPFQDLRGHTTKGREGRKDKREGQERGRGEGRKGEGKTSDHFPSSKFALRHWP